jgi:hypothetical protein
MCPSTSRRCRTRDHSGSHYHLLRALRPSALAAATLTLIPLPDDLPPHPRIITTITTNTSATHTSTTATHPRAEEAPAEADVQATLRARGPPRRLSLPLVAAIARLRRLSMEITTCPATCLTVQGLHGTPARQRPLSRLQRRRGSATTWRTS